jgi:hypothetical protein
MRTLPTFEVVVADVERVRQVIAESKNDPFVCERISMNVSGPIPKFNRERFWYVLMGCLLTTQQRSTTGSPVSRFLDSTDFPLTLEECGKKVEQVVKQKLTSFGGIRMAPTIARRARLNHAWLKKRGWTTVRRWFRRLAKQRGNKPKVRHIALERRAARYVASQLYGFGPKQSRNLWQWLRLTRYETPLDSRVVDWINENLSVRVNKSELGDDRYYEMVMDYLQEICYRAGVLPCVLDAAAFDNDNSRRKKSAARKDGCRKASPRRKM